MVKPRRRTMSFLEDDVPNIFRDEVRLLGLIGSLPASIRFFWAQMYLLKKVGQY